ncbi:MAG: hypothetical protein M3452_01045 [Chloroflexota bacterium]|nr:hypothetical protein [Chloroflexota bacterium]
MSHLTVAVSESAAFRLFESARDSINVSHSDSGTFGPVSASYAVAFHLEGGTLDFRSDGSVQIRELDIKWDTLQLSLGFDIPEFCVGGFCIIGIPFDGCAVRAPRLCAFSGNPDVVIPLDLSGILTSEVSFRAAPVIKHFRDPARPASMDYLSAQAAGIPDKWQLFIDPITVDIDIFDFADIVGDLLESAVDAAIDGLLSWMPGWARDLIRSLMGPVIDLVRAVLDIPDDFEEWLSDLLGVSLGLLDFVATVVGDHFAAQTPLIEIEDPLEILPGVPSVPLIPVKVPIEKLAVTVSDTEMVLEADVGA